MGKNTDFKFYELDHAINIGDLEAVKNLITVNVAMKIKNRALLGAARLEKIDILEWLIPISDPLFNDSDALFWAVIKQREQSVARLIPVSNPKVKESRALKGAAGLGSLAILKMLVPVSDVKNSNSFYGSPLMIASTSGHMDCLAYLLPRSRPDDQHKKTGETALMMAAAQGHKACVDLLLAVSAPELKDALGWSAADHAMENEHEALAQHIRGAQAAIRERKLLELEVLLTPRVSKRSSM